MSPNRRTAPPATGSAVQSRQSLTDSPRLPRQDDRELGRAEPRPLSHEDVLSALELTRRPEFMAGYAAGCLAGWHDGWAACEADMAAVWAETARQVRALGSPQSVPFSELCERRGQRERAERARGHERRVMST